MPSARTLQLAALAAVALAGGIVGAAVSGGSDPQPATRSASPTLPPSASSAPNLSLDRELVEVSRSQVSNGCVARLMRDATQKTQFARLLCSQIDAPSQSRQVWLATTSGPYRSQGFAAGGAEGPMRADLEIPRGAESVRILVGNRANARARLRLSTR
jgi:hypothetical protein